MAKDINLLCYKTIRSLDIPQKERNQLLIDLFEVGFTENLKKRLISYLDEDSEALKKRLTELKTEKKREI